MSRRWGRKSEHVLDDECVSKAQHKLREKIVNRLRTWEYGTKSVKLFIFGGLVSKTILSNHLIRNNMELQAALDAEDEDTLSNIPLPVSAFITLDTDMDLYIADLNNLNVKTHTDSIIRFLQEELPELAYFYRPKGGSCPFGSIRVCTWPHPLASLVSFSIDIITGSFPLLPDFSSNQLAVDLQTGNIGIFQPLQTKNPWWVNSDSLCRALQIPQMDHCSNFLCGELSMNHKATTAIIAATKSMSTTVILFSFARWSREYDNVAINATVGKYLEYVYHIRHCGQKLMEDGFAIHGFEQRMTCNGMFCEHSDFLISFDNMFIRCAFATGRLVPMDETLITLRNLKNGSDACSPDTINTLLWCGMCKVWHNLVTHLFSCDDYS
jgi:hypothetical protein